MAFIQVRSREIMVTSVVVVDDHGIVCEGVRRVLEGTPRIRVLATATDARSGIAIVLRERPQVVVMDLSMPGMNGIEAIRQIAHDAPEVAAIVLSLHASSEMVRQALDAGARGYVLKESLSHELIRAVLAVAAGRRYLGPGATHGVAKLIAGEAGANTIERLTPREREIVRLVAEGKSSAEVAALLKLSPRTVEAYRLRLMEKLGLTDLPALVRFAIREGLISVD